ncbi:hypothetical protein [Planobispora rosea]|nr:hypothetical protein [Planobispora rosea]
MMLAVLSVTAGCGSAPDLAGAAPSPVPPASLSPGDSGQPTPKTKNPKNSKNNDSSDRISNKEDGDDSSGNSFRSKSDGEKSDISRRSGNSETNSGGNTGGDTRRPSDDDDTDTAEPVTLSPRPWRTPRVSSPAGIRLDNRYPSNGCVIYWMSSTSHPITVEGLEVGDSTFTPSDQPAEGTGDFPIGTTSVRGEPCRGDNGVTAGTGCDAGAEISGGDGCGLRPDYAEPIRPGVYTLSLTWRLSTLCTGTSFAPCEGVDPVPTETEPVIAEWDATMPYCVEVRAETGDSYQVLTC